MNLLNIPQPLNIIQTIKAQIIYIKILQADQMLEEKEIFVPSGRFVEKIQNFLIKVEQQVIEEKRINSIIEQIQATEQDIRLKEIKNVGFYLAGIIPNLINHNQIKSLNLLSFFISYIIKEVFMTDSSNGVEILVKLFEPETQLLELIIERAKNHESGRLEGFDLIIKQLNCQQCLCILKKAYNSSLSRYLILLELIVKIIPLFQLSEMFLAFLYELNKAIETVLSEKSLELSHIDLKKMIIIWFQVQNMILSNENNQFSYKFILMILSSLFKKGNLEKKFIALAFLNDIVQRKPPYHQLTQLNEHFIPLFFDRSLHEELILKSLNILTFWLEFDEDIRLMDDWFELLTNIDKRIRNIYAELLLNSLLVCLYKLPKKKLLIIYDGIFEIGFEKNKEIFLEESFLKQIIDFLLTVEFSSEQQEMVKLTHLEKIWSKKKTKLFELTKGKLKEIVKNGGSPKFTEKICEYFGKRFSKVMDDKQIKEKRDNHLEYYQWINYIAESVEKAHQNSSLKSLEKYFHWKKNFGKHVLLSFLSEDTEQLQLILEFTDYLLQFNNRKEEKRDIFKTLLWKVNVCEEIFLIWLKDKVNNIAYISLIEFFREFFLKPPSNLFVEISPQSFKHLVGLLGAIFIDEGRLLENILITLICNAAKTQTYEYGISVYLQEHFLIEKLAHAQIGRKAIDEVYCSKMPNFLKYDTLRWMIMLSQRKNMIERPKSLSEKSPYSKKLTLSLSTKDHTFTHYCDDNIGVDQLYEDLKIPPHYDLQTKEEKGRSMREFIGYQLRETPAVSTPLMIIPGRNTALSYSSKFLKEVVCECIFGKHLNTKPLDQIIPPHYHQLKQAVLAMVQDKNWTATALIKSQFYDILTSLMTQNDVELQQELISLLRQHDPYEITEQMYDSTPLSIRAYLSTYEPLLRDTSHYLSISAKFPKPHQEEASVFALQQMLCSYHHPQLSKYILSCFSQLKAVKSAYQLAYSLQVLWVAMDDPKIYWFFISSHLYEQLFELAFQLVGEWKAEPTWERALVVLLHLLNKILNIQYYSISPSQTELLLATSLQILHPSSNLMKVHEYQLQELKKYTQDPQQQNITNTSYILQQIWHCVLQLQQLHQAQQVRLQTWQEVLKLLYGLTLFGFHKQTATQIQSHLLSKDPISKVCVGLLILCMRGKVEEVAQIGVGVLMEQELMKREQYYELVLVMVEEKYLPAHILHSLWEQFLDKLAHHKWNDEQSHANQQLQWMVKTMKVILPNSGEQFIGCLWRRYLFKHDSLQQTQILGKHPHTRKVLYETVITLLKQIPIADGNNILKSLKELMSAAHELPDQPKEIGVGLQNLGNTCYINSLLQVLRSIDEFTQAICEEDCLSPVVEAMKDVMTELTLTKRSSISAEKLLWSFNPPIDPSLQEDTTQFLIKLITKLSEQSAGLNNMIKKQLKGSTVTIMTCGNCGKRRKTKEEFLAYSVEIEDRKMGLGTLERCIEHSKEPEIVMDVFCEECEKKTEWEKKSQIEEVPPYLFIHLKRLVFDYQFSFQKIKIHSYLHFPHHLQLQQQNMELVGVITHAGDGNAGHYFTSIKEDNKWVVYNDSQVTYLPPQQQPSIWYGNNDDLTHSTNAYMLVYRAKAAKQLEWKWKSKMLESIVRENKELEMKKYIFGEEYRQDFIKFYYECIQLPSVSNAIGEVYQGMAALTYPYKVVPPIHYLSTKWNANHIPALIEQMLQYKQYNIQLLFSPVKDVRLFTAQYLIVLFRLAADSHCRDPAIIYALELIATHVHNVALCDGWVQILTQVLKQFGQQPPLIDAFHENQVLDRVMALYHSMHEAGLKEPIIGGQVIDSMHELLAQCEQLKVQWILQQEEDLEVKGEVKVGVEGYRLVKLGEDISQMEDRQSRCYVFRKISFYPLVSLPFTFIRLRIYLSSEKVSHEWILPHPLPSLYIAGEERWHKMEIMVGSREIKI